MNYLQSLPDELINIIGLYIDYTATNILTNSLNIKINYKYLLRYQYPAFFKIIGLLALNDSKWVDYPWSMFYDDINMTIKIILYKMKSDTMWKVEYLYSNNIKEFVSLYIKNNIKFDILDAYFILYRDYDPSGTKYYKYRSNFPNIPNMEHIFISSIDNFDINIRLFDYIEDYTECTDFTDSSDALIILYFIYLYFLIRENIETRDIENIRGFKLLSKDNGEFDHNEMILYQYIMERVDSLIRNI